MVQVNTSPEKFRTTGHLVRPGLLTSDEVAYYKTVIQKLLGVGDDDFDTAKAARGGWDRADAVTQEPDLWPLITHPRILETVRSALGPDVKYTQHSDIHIHKGTVGWHRDSANRTFGVGPDWDESRAPYSIVRVCIYLQTFAESGSALGVLPGTHRAESRALRAELEIMRVLRRGLRVPNLMWSPRTVRPGWAQTEPGDTVVFDQRLYHTGTRIHGPKNAIFLSYGLDNEHSRRHVNYYYARKELAYKPPPEALRRRLDAEGLLLKV